MKKNNVSKLISSVFVASIITAFSTIFVDDKKYPLAKITRNIAIVAIFIATNAAYILMLSDKSDEEEHFDYEDDDSYMDFDDDDDDLDD